MTKINQKKRKKEKWHLFILPSFLIISCKEKANVSERGIRKPGHFTQMYQCIIKPCALQFLMIQFKRFSLRENYNTIQTYTQIFLFAHAKSFCTQLHSVHGHNLTIIYYHFLILLFVMVYTFP